jgi:drug/metabolite transporter (DMT)-like permease
VNEFIHGIGAGRLMPTSAAVAGLIGVVIGGLALVRSRRTGNGRAGAIVAAALGLISLVVGGLHTAYSAGGFGTGSGLAGAIVAIVLGMLGLVFGGLALACSRRLVPDSHPGEREPEKLDSQPGEKK